MSYVERAASGPIGLNMRVDVSAGEEQDWSIDVLFTGDIAAEVVEVADDGGYVVHSSLTNLQIDSSDSDIASEMEQSFPDSATFEEVFDAQGQLVSSEVLDTDLTATELEAVEEFNAQTATGSLFPPGVPVGLGATWTATSYLHSSGAEIEMAVLNELTSLVESDCTVAMTIDSDIDTELEGEHLTGSVTGVGYVSGSRTNPLVLGGTMTIDMELSGAGMSMTLDMYVSYDFTDQPA